MIKKKQLECLVFDFRDKTYLWNIMFELSTTLQ